MNRRKFIKTSCLACTGSVIGTLLLETCTSTKTIHSSQQTNNNQLVIKKSEFIVLKNDKTIHRKFIVVKSDNVSFPIAVYQIQDNIYNALLLQCTHQGCELSPYETTLVCPCHGAEFNPKGDVSQGPAEANLKSFLTTSDTENIYIQL